MRGRVSTLPPTYDRARPRSASRPISKAQYVASRKRVPPADGEDNFVPDVVPATNVLEEEYDDAEAVESILVTESGDGGGAIATRKRKQYAPIIKPKKKLRGQSPIPSDSETGSPTLLLTGTSSTKTDDKNHRLHKPYLSPVPSPITNFVKPHGILKTRDVKVARTSKPSRNRPSRSPSPARPPRPIAPAMAVRPARGSSAQKSARGKLVVDVLVPTLKQLYRSQTIPVHAGKSHQQSDPFDNLQSSTNKVFVRSTSKDSSRKAKASKTKPKLENAHKPSPRKRKIISQQTDQSNDDEQNVYIEREYTRIYAVRRTFDDTPIGLAGARMSSTLMRKAHGNNDDEVIGTRAGFNGYIDHPHRQPSSSRSGSVGATTHARAPIQRTKSTYKTPAAIQFQAALTELIRVKSEASDLSRDELIKAYAQLRDIRDDLKELLEKIVEP